MIFLGFVILAAIQVLLSKMERIDLEKKLKWFAMATQAEIQEGLDKLTAQIGKVAKEQSDRFDVCTAKIAELTAAINAGEVKPEVAAALAAAQAALQSLDETIPDAP